MAPMTRMIGGRILQGAVVLLVLSFVIFVGLELLPGDAARTVAGGRATPQQLESIRSALELDRPLLARYGDWISSAVRGDLGYSLTQGSATATSARVPVTEIVERRALNSLILAAGAAIVIYPLAVLLGTLSAVRAGGRLDTLIGSTTLGLIALPEFVVGLTLVLALAIVVPLFPAISFVEPGMPLDAWLVALALPVATICAAFVAQTTRICRASMIEALASDYVRMARLKGIPERRVIVRHALRNALAPAIQAMALNFSYLLGGIVVVEQVFGYPGLGAALLGAVRARDVPTVQAATLIIATAFVVLNLVSDLIGQALSPRSRTA